MAEHGWTAELAAWILQMAAPLNVRLRWRLAPLLWGVLWAKGRRPVSRWIAAAGLSDDWQRYDYFLEPVGRKAKQISQRLLWLLIKQLPLEDGPFVGTPTTGTQHHCRWTSGPIRGRCDPTIARENSGSATLPLRRALGRDSK